MKKVLRLAVEKKRWGMFFAASIGLILVFLCILSIDLTHLLYKTPEHSHEMVMEEEAHEDMVDHANDDVLLINELESLVFSQNPSVAFARLRSLIAEDAHTEVHCHDFVHVIGDAAYRKYGDYHEALAYNDDLCGSGYIHQLITNALSGEADPLAVITSICEGYDGYCYHGIGHGLMFYTENDIPRSLEMCKALATSEQANRCSEGVFMQNFEDHQMYPTPYVYMDDPLRLCREEGKFKPACYLYAGAYLAEHFEGESGIFQVCAGAEEDRVIECVRGIGHFLIGNYLDDKDQAIAICDSATSEQVKNACIDGLVSYHLVIYNSVSTTETFCASFPEEDQDTCMASVEARKMFYLEESKTNL